MTEVESVFMLALGALARYPQLLPVCGLIAEDFPGSAQTIYRALAVCSHDPQTGAVDLGELAVLAGEAAADLPYAPSPEAAQRRIDKARQYATHAACSAALRPLTVAIASGESPATLLLGEVESFVEAMRSRFGVAVSPPTAAEIVRRWIATEAQHDAAVTQAERYWLGLPTLDRCLNAIHPGECVVIASRPGEGKTTMATQLAEGWSSSGKAGLYFSAEMSHADLAERLAHRIAGRSSLHRLSPAERSRVQEMLPGYTQLERIKVHDCRRITMGDVRRLVSSEVMRGGGYFVIDNLKHVDSHTAERDVERFGRTVRELRQLAGEYLIPVVILHHLSRRAEYAEANDEDPSSAWLKGSGSIEEEADIVLFLQAPKNDALAGTDADGRADALIVKSRRTGAHGIKVSLAFDKATQQFRERTSGDA